MLLSVDELAQIRYILGIEPDPENQRLKSTWEQCEPRKALVESAIQLIPAIVYLSTPKLEPIEFRGKVSFSEPIYTLADILAKLCERGHAKQAASWAVYRSVERGLLYGSNPLA